jgi:hypothetical protein
MNPWGVFTWGRSQAACPAQIRPVVSCSDRFMFTFHYTHHDQMSAYSAVPESKSRRQQATNGTQSALSFRSPVPKNARHLVIKVAVDSLVVSESR